MTRTEDVRMMLVTGSSGNVGRALVPKLVARGVRVRALVRTARPAVEGVEHVLGDLDRPETLPAALEGVDTVYLVAFETRQVRHLVEAARRAGVRRVVRQSTIEAGFDPPLGPGRWHRDQERLVEDAGFAFTHLRPTMMMSNTVLWWAGSIAAEGVVHFPGGEGRLSPVSPADIARLAAHVLVGQGHEGKAYDVTGPELLTMGALVASLGQVLGKPLRYLDVPEAAAAAHLRQGGLPDEVVEGLLATLRGIRAGAFEVVSNAVLRVTGERPATFASWAADHAAAFARAS